MKKETTPVWANDYIIEELMKSGYCSNKEEALKELHGAYNNLFFGYGAKPSFANVLDCMGENLLEPELYDEFLEGYEFWLQKVSIPNNYKNDFIPNGYRSNQLTSIEIEVSEAGDAARFRQKVMGLTLISEWCEIEYDYNGEAYCLLSGNKEYLNTYMRY